MNGEEHLARVLDAHFDPRWGSPWWLARVRELGFDPRREIRSLSDLALLPSVPRDALATCAVETFVPRRFHAEKQDWIVSETGGTTGPPCRTVFLPDEFEAAFVTPFVASAARLGFPRNDSWLFIGPSGPHVIGKAARVCAHAMGAMDPFTVDLDPRWVRRLVPGSLARRRYTEHVVAQATAILESQEIGVLFATPPLIAALGGCLPSSIRHRVGGVHIGGMAADGDFLLRLRDEWFPSAVALAGYGNSLAGVCLEIETSRPNGPEYFPHGNRLILDVVETNEAGRGRVRFHRLDRGGLLPNMDERDEAAPVKRLRTVVEEEFSERGIRDPRPRVDPNRDAGAQTEGIY